MTVKRILIIVLVLVVVLPVIAVTVFIAQFDPNSYAPALEAAVQSATGRQLTLGGPIKLALSLTPSIEVDDVSLSNPPGVPGAFLTLDHLEARIALLPLLSHRADIIKLLLSGPNISLQKNAAGTGNWDFAPSAPATAPSSRGGTSSGGYKIALEAVEIQNGTLTVKKPQGGTTGVLAIADLTGTAESVSAPLTLAAQASYNNVPFTLNGVTGPVERFSGVGRGPWPVNLTLATKGATATVKGDISDPRTATGYNLSVNASIPALEALAPLLNGVTLPPIHGITAAASISDQGSTLPAINNLSIKAATSDLSSLHAGLSLTALDIELPSLNQTLTFKANGSENAMPVSISGATGAPALVLNPAWLPPASSAQGNFPLSVQAQAGDAKLSLTGALATPSAYAGAALALSITAPDLSRLSPLAGAALPAWKNLNVQANVIDPGGLGLTKSAGLDSLVLTMDNASLGGDASLYFGSQPRLTLALKVQRINLDALLAAFPASSPPATPPATSTTPPNPYVVPTSKFPLQTLQSASADIQLSADKLIWKKATYTAIQGHAVLANGILTINPLTALLPGGSVAATATLDATKDPAAAAVTINAPALALGPFLKSLNLPDTAEGTMQARLNASGTGDSPHDIMATVNGQLGLAMVNGIIDGTVLDRLFGAVLRTVDLPENLVGAQGPVAVRCFALRMDASNGTGTIRALTLDSSRLLMQGGGGLNFGNETLGVILRPQLQVIGNGIGVPVEVSGTFANPTTSVAPLGALQEAAKTALGLPVSLAQQVVGSGTVLGNIVGALGGGGGDTCPTALSLGRLGNPGPEPAAITPTQGLAPRIISGPKNLLNSLFK
jgi:AsmA protein